LAVMVGSLRRYRNTNVTSALSTNSFDEKNELVRFGRRTHANVKILGRKPRLPQALT
jgi:hypothetical protein